MERTVIIDESVILSLLNDAAFAATIPCLQNKREIFSAGATTCGTCIRKLQERQRNEMAALKACIAGLSAEKKAALRKKLGADKAKIIYVNISRQVVDLTF